MPPQCSAFCRVRGHILVVLLCVLCRPQFLTDFFSKIYMEVHHSQIYTPIVFGIAAPIFLSFIGSKVIFWWMSFVHTRPHFLTDFFQILYRGQVYTPIVLGDASSSVPSFIGSKVILWFAVLRALCQPHLFDHFFPSDFMTDFFPLQILYGGVS